MSYTKPNDWTEDFEHENGNYANACTVCGSMFRGHKRRVVCKLCADKTIAQVREVLQDKEMRHAFDEFAMREVMALVDSQARQLTKQAIEIERLKDRLRFEMQPEAKDGV